MRRTPRSTLFPYTTLFRSRLREADRHGLREVQLRLDRDVEPEDRRVGPKVAVELVVDRRTVSDANHGAGPWGQSDAGGEADRKSTRLNSSHGYISYAVFCL